MSTAAHAPSQRFHVLDLARFMAALAVVLFHYYFRGWVTGGQSPLRFPAVGPWLRYGYLGVQFFFMISGFVIFMSAQGRTAHQFAYARFLRLFPAYWFAVLTTAGVIALWGAPLFQVSWWQVVINLTMLQQFLHVTHVDGVYWTLTYELVFYAWIYFMLISRRLEQFSLWCLAMLVISSVSKVLPMPGWLKLLLLADYAPYFIAGALFYLQTRSPLRTSQRVLLAWAIALMLAQATGEAPAQSERYATPMSELTIAAIIIGFTLFFASVSAGWWKSTNYQAFLILGSMSYPLYLLHQFIGYTIFNISAPLAPAHTIAGATLMLMLAIAFLVSRHLEPAGAELIKEIISRPPLSREQKSKTGPLIEK